MMANNREKVLEKLANSVEYRSFQINQDFNRRDEIIGINESWEEARYSSFNNLGISGLGDLIIEDYIYPFHQVNNMPPLKDIYLFICKYPAIKLGGRVFNPKGRRPRYDTNIDQLIVNEADVTTEMKQDFIAFCSTADEINTTNGLYCWWD